MTCQYEVNQWKTPPYGSLRELVDVDHFGDYAHVQELIDMVTDLEMAEELDLPDCLVVICSEHDDNLGIVEVLYVVEYFRTKDAWYQFSSTSHGTSHIKKIKERQS